MPPKKFTGPRAAVAESKQRKPWAPKQKPEDMSNAEWDRDVQRRRAETQGRKDRLAKLKLKQADAAAEAKEEAATVMDRNVALSRARIGLPPIHAGQYPHGWDMGSPAGFSPSSPAMFQENYGHITPRTRFSSPSPDHEGYAAHGGFDPNLEFPSCPCGPPIAGVFDPSFAATASLCRGPLPFGSSMGASSSYQGTVGTDAASVFAGMPDDSVMHDIIASGSAVAGGSSGYCTQEEARTNVFTPAEEATI